MGSGTNESAKAHDARRAWRLLWSNPDYVEDWRVNGAPVLKEAAPFRKRRAIVSIRRGPPWYGKRD